jgi:nitrite reductase (NADH) large subunit
VGPTQRILLGTSFVAALLTLSILLAGPLPPSNAMEAGWTVDVLWRESLWQQVSGYALAGLVLVGLSFSLRKRWRWLSSVSYQAWRLVHAFLGAATLLVLVLHTGLRLGTGLNFLLMTDYLGLVLTGAIMGIFVVRTQTPRTTRLRARVFTFHLGLLWVFPTLLGFHILAVYYY